MSRRKRRGPGRPPGSLNEASNGVERTFNLTVRVSEAERAAIKRRAKREGLLVGAYVRWALRRDGALP